MKISRWPTQSTAKYCLGIIALITILLGWHLQSLQISYDFEAFFPKNDPAIANYQKHLEQFGTDNDFILLAIESEQLFEEEWMQQYHSLGEALQNLEQITTVISITRLSQLVISPLGAYQVPIYDSTSYHRHRFQKKITEHPAWSTNFLSADSNALSMVLLTEEKLSKQASDQLLSALNKVLDSYRFLGKQRIAGRVHGQQYYIDLMFWELIVFGASSVLLLIIFLYISFRSWWGIVLPLVVVLATVIWLLGGLAWAGQSISMLTTIMPTILFVVGVSDVVHFIEKYLEELRNGQQKKAAVKKAIQEIGLATFLTSLTTSIGFLTLLSANMIPVQEFGYFTAIGVWIAYILAFTLIPAALLLVPTSVLAKQSKGFWYPYLHRWLRWILQHKYQVLGGALVLFVVSLIGVSQIKVNNYLLEDLSADDPVKKEYQYFETHFNGVRPFELLIRNKEGKFALDYPFIQDLFKLNQYLTEAYGLNYVLGIHEIVAEINQAKHGGNINYRKLPEKNQWQSIERLLMRSLNTDRIQNLVNRETGTFRLTTKTVDYGGLAFRKKNKALHEFWENLPTSQTHELKVTGMAHLIDKNNELLSENMLIGLLIAFAIISGIIALLFQSVRYIFIALIPNVFPLLMIGGFMGFSGIDLKVSTSIIFTIAFGIAVDDTIHFLSKLKLELNKGKTVSLALRNTFLSTGKAIIVTSIILCAGFWTLLFSSFASTFYVGLLISLSLLFAVLSDLFLIPLLVIYLHKKDRKKITA